MAKCVPISAIGRFCMATGANQVREVASGNAGCSTQTLSHLTNRHSMFGYSLRFRRPSRPHASTPSRSKTRAFAVTRARTLLPCFPHRLITTCDRLLQPSKPSARPSAPNYRWLVRCSELSAAPSDEMLDLSSWMSPVRMAPKYLRAGWGGFKPQVRTGEKVEWEVCNC